MATKITPDVWDRHKDAILGMRRSGLKVKGRGGIVETMRKDYGFQASRHQYEHQLGKWEARKYLHANEWSRILQVIDQFRAAGKHCQVFKDGQRISERILTKRSIYGPRCGHAKTSQVSMSALPDCITIRPISDENRNSNALESGESNDAPSNRLSESAIPLSAAQLAPDASYETEGTDSEMSIEEPSGENATLNQTISTSHSPFDTRQLTVGNGIIPPALNQIPEIESWEPYMNWVPSANALEASPAWDLIDFQRLSPEENAILGMFSGPGSDRPSNQRSNLEESSSGFESEFGSPERPTSVFQDSSSLLGIQHSLNTNIQITNGVPQYDAILGNSSPKRAFSENHAHSSRQDCQPSQLATWGDGYTIQNWSLANPDALKSNVAALVPSHDSPTTTLLSNRRHALVKAFKSPIYRILISSIENNFAGLDGVLIGDTLRLLKQDSLMRSRLILYLQRTPKAVATALVEKLIAAAIEERDAFTLRELLGTRLVDVNSIVCSFEGDRFTAVERSAMLCGSDNLKILLAAGADATKSLVRDGARSSALMLALRAMEINGFVDIFLITMLLKHGLKASIGTLFIAVNLKHQELIDLIFSNMKNNTCPDRRFHSERSFDPVGRGIFLNIIDNLADDAAAKVVEQLLLMLCTRLIYDPFHAGPQRQVEESIIKATMRAATKGYFKTLKSLLPFTKNTSAALSVAIRNGSKDMIQLLRDSQANSVNRTCQLEGDLVETTPLAEAIRAQNDELLQEFASQAVWTRPDEENDDGRSF